MPYFFYEAAPLIVTTPAIMHRKYTNIIYKETYTVATPLQILTNSNMFQELSSINVNRLNYVILGQVIIENQTLATIFF